MGSFKQKLLMDVMKLSLQYVLPGCWYLMYTHIFKHAATEYLLNAFFPGLSYIEIIFPAIWLKACTVSSLDWDFYFRIWNTVSLQTVDTAATSANLKFHFCLKFNFRRIYAVLTVTAFLSSETLGPEFLKYLDFVQGFHMFIRFSSNSKTFGAVCMASA